MITYQILKGQSPFKEKYMEENMFNNEELEKVKQKALEDHIPIIMDETLEEKRF